MERNILYQAINKLKEVNGFNCEILATDISVENHIVDGQILLKNAKKKWKYNVEVRTKVVPTEILLLKERLKNLQPFILVAEYITTKAKEILRSNNMAYLDTVGNLFLQNKDVYIYIETNTSNRSKLNKENSAFLKTGLKVIFQFLINPNYLNKSYRFIGKESKTSIDTVRKVIKELLKDKYIIQKTEKEYIFSDRTKLFQEWVTAFNKNLRPTLKQSRYRFLIKDTSWRNLTLPEKTCWGGGVAAEIQTDVLIAKDNILLYTELPFQDIMKHLKIVPDPNGKILVMEGFWNIEESQDIASYILLYADLLYDGRPRYIEIATKIYKEYVESQL